MDILAAAVEGAYDEAREKIARKIKTFPLLSKALLRIMTSPDCERLYDGFIHEYAGDPSDDSAVPDGPLVQRGNFLVRDYGGCTADGEFVVIRRRPYPMEVCTKEDFLGVTISLREQTQTIWRIEDFNSSLGGRSYTLNSGIPINDSAGEFEPIRTNNPFRDILDEWDLRDTDAADHDGLARLIISHNGGDQSSYFRRNGTEQKLAASLSLFDQQLKSIPRHFGELALLAQNQSIGPAIVQG